jgi:hypothetical protein
MSEELIESKVYEKIKNTVVQAQEKVYATMNFAMAETYWNIGKRITEAQGGNKGAEYGTGLLKFLSKKLTEEFVKDILYEN